MRAKGAEAGLVFVYDIIGIATKLASFANAVEQVFDASLATLRRISNIVQRWAKDCLHRAFRRGDELIVDLDPISLFSRAY